MPCRSCRDKANAAAAGHLHPMPPMPPIPCPPCALEHLKLAEAAQRAGDLYRAVWHLAQAATHAATRQQAAALRDARIALQRINNNVDFARLRQLIGGPHAEH
ncbi:MAG: hypothetical protein GX945_02335 [Lentisphaerae bacterium]|nr:hypothetical protein [Lentisphaerota bacterium]